MVKYDEIDDTSCKIIYYDTVFFTELLKCTLSIKNLTLFSIFNNILPLRVKYINSVMIILFSTKYVINVSVVIITLPVLHQKPKY